MFYTRQSGYDTHSQQPFPHPILLGEFAAAVAAFFADLKATKPDDRVRDGILDAVAPEGDRSYRILTRKSRCADSVHGCSNLLRSGTPRAMWPTGATPRLTPQELDFIVLRDAG